MMPTGFLDAAEMLFEKMQKTLSDQDVVVIGHSYGGSVGAILTYLLSEQNICKSVKCISFGPPPCFSDEMC